MYKVLRWARLQPRIVYEETVMRDGLDRIRVLVMPACDVLSRSVADAVLEFQRKGGIVVGDEALAPAIMPDILVRLTSGSAGPDKRKAELQALSQRLRDELKPFYSWPVDSDNPDVIVRVRRSTGGARYLFAYNDKRTFGDYVGQHGLVMEEGLPTSARLSIQGRGSVYDLVAHEQVAPEKTADGLAIPTQFAPGGGRVLMVTDQRIARVAMNTPQAVKRGEDITVKVAVKASLGRRVRADVPIQIEILNAAGEPAEFSGFYAARDGRLTVVLNVALNEPPGTWRIRAVEQASGLMAERTTDILP